MSACMFRSIWLEGSKSILMGASTPAISLYPCPATRASKWGLDWQKSWLCLGNERSWFRTYRTSVLFLGILLWLGSVIWWIGDLSWILLLPRSLQHGYPTIACSSNYLSGTSITLPRSSCRALEGWSNSIQWATQAFLIASKAQWTLARY